MGIAVTPNPSLSSISDFFANATKLIRGGQEQNMTNIHPFFEKLVSLLKQKRIDDLRLASDFNIFDYIQPDELKLSRIIASCKFSCDRNGGAGRLNQHHLTRSMAWMESTP